MSLSGRGEILECGKLGSLWVSWPSLGLRGIDRHRDCAHPLPASRACPARPCSPDARPAEAPRPTPAPLGSVLRWSRAHRPRGEHARSLGLCFGFD